MRRLRYIAVEKKINGSRTITFCLSSANNIRTSPVYDNPQIVAYKSSCKNLNHRHRLKTKFTVSDQNGPEQLFYTDNNYCSPVENFTILVNSFIRNSTPPLQHM